MVFRKREAGTSMVYSGQLWFSFGEQVMQVMELSMSIYLILSKSRQLPRNSKR